MQRKLIISVCLPYQTHGAVRIHAQIEEEADLLQHLSGVEMTAAM